MIMRIEGPAEAVGDELELLLRCLPERAKVLELGCGAARQSRALATSPRVAAMVASDVDEVQHAKNLALAPVPKLSFAAFGAAAIEARDASFDAVVLFKSLHHVPVEQMDRALAEIRRVLKPGALAWVSEPVFKGAYSELIRLFDDEESVRRAAFEALERAVRRGRFELEREFFFEVRRRFESFDQFTENTIAVSYATRCPDAATLARVRERYAHLANDGELDLGQLMRVDVLRRSRGV